jgi:hypothetical protein
VLNEEPFLLVLTTAATLDARLLLAPAPHE